MSSRISDCLHWKFFRSKQERECPVSSMQSELQVDVGLSSPVTDGAKKFLRTREKRLLLDNQWVAPASGEHFATLDPATGENLALIARGSTADVEAAVTSAKTALAR